jgi:hypothetical protein
LKGHRLNPFVVGHRQHDTRSLDLKPWQGATAGNLLENRYLMSSQQNSVWFSASHGQPP